MRRSMGKKEKRLVVKNKGKRKKGGEGHTHRRQRSMIVVLVEVKESREAQEDDTGRQPQMHYTDDDDVSAW